MAHLGCGKRPRPNYDESSTDEDDRMIAERIPRRVVKLVPKAYTYVELQRFLRGHCAHELDLIPKIDTSSFTSWVASRKRLSLKLTVAILLYLGDVESPLPDLRDSIFVYVGGDDNNRIGLLSGRTGEGVPLHETVTVQPAKPFWYLFTHGRAIDQDESKRMRALVCFLFLAAGHLETVGHYSSFLSDLTDAILYYGRGIEAESIDIVTAPISNSPSIDSAKAPNMESNQIEIPKMQRKVTDRVAPTTPFLQKQLHSDRNGPTTSSTTELDLLATKMKGTCEQLLQNVTSYHNRSLVIASNSDRYASLEKNFAQQTKDLEALHQKVEERDTKIRKLDQEVQHQKELWMQEKMTSTDINKQLDHWRSQVSALEADRNVQRAKRIAAEKRLEDIRKAQESITAMLGNPQK